MAEPFNLNEPVLLSNETGAGVIDATVSHSLKEGWQAAARTATPITRTNLFTI